MGRAVELHIKTLPILEGTVKHEDLGKITTLPYGIVNDPDKNLKATNRNKKAAKSLGYNLNDLTTDQAKEVATKISNDIDKQLSKNSKVGKEYLNLSSRSILGESGSAGEAARTRLDELIDNFKKFSRAYEPI